MITVMGDFYDFISPYSLAFVSIEKLYQTLETVFHLISKHLEFSSKMLVVFSTFFSVFGNRMKHCLVFDILLQRRLFWLVSPSLAVIPCPQAFSKWRLLKMRRGLRNRLTEYLSESFHYRVCWLVAYRLNSQVSSYLYWKIPPLH